MKVMLLNGSPRGEMCTYTALKSMGEVFKENNIDFEIFNIGNGAIRGCISCGNCKKSEISHCIFDDDTVNSFVDKMKSSDALVVGSPVHYASACGAVSSFMDRASICGGKFFQYKPAACVVSCRRGGASATFDQLNKYFTILNMPIVSSNYWNMVHGNTPDEVLKDEEGIQTIKLLAENMVWILNLIESGKKNGILHPIPDDKIKTNFIR